MKTILACNAVFALAGALIALYLHDSSGWAWLSAFLGWTTAWMAEVTS